MTTKNKSTTTIPEPSAEERRLQGVSADLGEEQLKAMFKQGDLQDLLYGLAPETVSSFSDLLDSPTDELTNQLTDLEMQSIREGGAPSQYEKDYISQQAEEDIGLGMSDINSRLQSSLVGLREDEATARGLRPTDTPILNKGQQYGAQAVGEAGQLTRQIRSRQQDQLLSQPLQRGQVTGQLNESLRVFQEQLRNQAASNRLNLINSIAAPGLGLAQTGNVTGSLGALATPRLASANQTSSVFNPSQTAGNVAGSYLAYKRA